MIIKLKRSYKKLNKSGIPVTVFVYSVHGTEEQLKEYESAQGEYYRVSEDQEPIWFSTKFIGNSGKLIITSNGKCVPDTSEYDQAASLAVQYGGNLGVAIANSYAARLTGTTPVQAPVLVTEPDDKL